MSFPRTSRRAFLQHSALAATAAACGSPALARADQPPLKRVAMINSIYRFRSHAYHLGRRILHGYHREAVHHQPALKLARMFNDQYPADDMSRAEAPRYGYEVVKTPAEALGRARASSTSTRFCSSSNMATTKRTSTIRYSIRATSCFKKS